jgi:hypothetical protein
MKTSSFEGETMSKFDRKMMAALATDGPLTPEQISGFTPRQISGFTPEQISGFTPEQISGFTPRQISGFTPRQISGFTPRQISGFTPRQISGFTPEQISGFTPEQISGLSAEGLAAHKNFWDAVPKIEAPYSTMLADIRAHRRIHNQSTFGPDADPKENLCGSPMCTAGHLVNMAGEAGYELKEKFGWADAARFIHLKSRPDVPPQNFGSIPQAWALAYIEERAEEEQAAAATATE